LQVARDGRILKTFRHQKSKERQATMAINNWMQSIRLKRIITRDQRIQGIMLRFVAGVGPNWSGSLFPAVQALLTIESPCISSWAPGLVQCKRRMRNKARTNGADMMRMFLRHAKHQGTKNLFGRFKSRVRVVQVVDLPHSPPTRLL
jgi:hypothetical protein